MTKDTETLKHSAPLHTEEGKAASATQRKEKAFVVKVGGAVVEDEAQLARLISDFSALPGRKVLVHGGGRRATKVAATLGIESQRPRPHGSRHRRHTLA